MTSTERAVRKASGARLLRDMAWAARIYQAVIGTHGRVQPSSVLALAETRISRTRYACLMTAFGQ